MEYNFDFPIYKESTDESDNITALYIRYSELESANESNDIEVQYEALKQYCIDNEVSNPVIFIADNYMGSDANRPAYQSMLKQLKSGKIKKAIFYCADRMGRTPSVIINFFKDCPKYKFDFHIIKDHFDSKDRKALDTILSVITNFQNLPRFGY